MAEQSTHLAQYYKLAENLITKVTKEDLAECAQLLAMNIAHYQAKYGELPLEGKLTLIGMHKANEEQVQLMTDGMGIFVGVLGNVVAGLGQERH